MHIDRIQTFDKLGRASDGFKATINMMMSDDKTNLLPQFVEHTNRLDNLRKQNTAEVFPELGSILNA